MAALITEAKEKRPHPFSADEDRLLLRYVQITSAAVQLGREPGELLRLSLDLILDDLQETTRRATQARRKFALRQLRYALNTFALLAEPFAQSTGADRLVVAAAPELHKATALSELGVMPPVIRILLRFELDVLLATTSIEEDDDLEFFAARAMEGAKQLAPHLDSFLIQTRLLLLAARMQELTKQTSAIGWDFEHGVAIPEHEWNAAFNLCARVTMANSKLPLPTPSPCGDGTIHLRWSRGSAHVVVELRGDDTWWTRTVSGARSAGHYESRDEVRHLLNETFA